VPHQLSVVAPRAYLGQRRDVGAADVLLARKHPKLALNPEGSSEARRDRVLGPLLPVLRVAALAALRVRPDGALGRRWFSRVRRLEYLAGVRAAGGMPGRHAVRILCYHSIAARRDDPLARYSVPPERFRAQLAFLARRFRPISGSELLRLLDGTGGVPRRALLLTFDDCYADLLMTALPLLEERGLPALAFVVSGRIGATNDWDGRRGGEPAGLLGAEELAKLVERGIELGAHSRTHAVLTRLDDEQLRDELVGSARDLDALGLPWLPVLAYPFGVHDERVRRAAEAAGYRSALTVERGIVDPEAGDRFALPRIQINARDRGPLFWWKVMRAPRLEQRPRAQRAS
jgi:peptidoglycan/xylan/chitin deacetylase (PgdA/CDA1 family)